MILPPCISMQPDLQFLTVKEVCRQSIVVYEKQVAHLTRLNRTARSGHPPSRRLLTLAQVCLSILIRNPLFPKLKVSLDICSGYMKPPSKRNAATTAASHTGTGHSTFPKMAEPNSTPRRYSTPSPDSAVMELTVQCPLLFLLGRPFLQASREHLWGAALPTGLSRISCSFLTRDRRQMVFLRQERADA
jgi:hypothetical protein